MAMNIVSPLPEEVARVVEMHVQAYRLLPEEAKMRVNMGYLLILQKDTPIPEEFIMYWLLQLVYPSWNSSGVESVVYLEQTFLYPIYKLTRVLKANDDEVKYLQGFNNAIWRPNSQKALSMSRLIFIPLVHVHDHWSLIIVYIRERQIIHYNTKNFGIYEKTTDFPTQSPNDISFMRIIQWFADHIGRERWIREGWTHESIQFVDQVNNTDSGLWVMLTMRLALSHQGETNRLGVLGREDYAVRKQEIEKFRTLIGAEMLAGEFCPQTTRNFPPLIRSVPFAATSEHIR